MVNCMLLLDTTSPKCEIEFGLVTMHKVTEWPLKELVQENDCFSLVKVMVAEVTNTGCGYKCAYALHVPDS
jgi:hypothetical protein